MKTYEEAMLYFCDDASDSETVFSRLRRFDCLKSEVYSSKETRHLLAAIGKHTCGSTKTGLMHAFMMGIVVGIEMEKQEK